MVWAHPLFFESVRLLLRHPEVELVGQNSDYTAAREDIVRLKPDTILVERSGSSIPAGAMDILNASSWSIRVIGLSLDDNDLSVYHREKQTVGQADDLLRLIHSD